MKVFRAILVGLAGLFFLIFVFGALVLGVINLTIGGAPQLKSLLKDGKVYETIVPAILKEVSKQQAKENNGDNDKLPISKPEIVAAAQKGFTPELLQKNSELAIDGVFSWLDGKTPTPQFSLDFSGGKDGFADGVGQYATSFMQNLPVCTKGQSKEFDDVFSATCRPASLNITAQATKLTNNLKNNAEIFKNTTVSSESLKLDEKTEKLKKVPKIYKLFKMSPMILSGLAVLSGLVIIFASTERRKGIARVARSLLFAGFVVLASIAGITALRTFLDKKIQNSGGQSAGFATDVITPLLNKAASQVNHTNMIIGIILVVAAIATLILLRITKPKVPASAASKEKKEEPEVAAAKKIVDQTKAPVEEPKTDVGDKTDKKSKPDSKSS